MLLSSSDWCCVAAVGTHSDRGTPVEPRGMDAEGCEAPSRPARRRAAQANIKHAAPAFLFFCYSLRTCIKVPDLEKPMGGTISSRCPQNLFIEFLTQACLQTSFVFK